MYKGRIIILLVILTLAGGLMFAAPSPVYAQEADPVEEAAEAEYAGEILVFVPQLYWEFPLANGFKITFNFGLTIELPRQLMLLQDDAFNFFLSFDSYMRPAEGE